MNQNPTCHLIRGRGISVRVSAGEPTVVTVQHCVERARPQIISAIKRSGCDREIKPGVFERAASDVSVRALVTELRWVRFWLHRPVKR